MIVIFHQNMSHSGGESTLHGLTTLHSPRFFLALEKIPKRRKLSRETSKPDSLIFSDTTCDDNCGTCKRRGSCNFSMYKY